jgi:hypothetical protein
MMSPRAPETIRSSVRVTAREAAWIKFTTFGGIGFLQRGDKGTAVRHIDAEGFFGIDRLARRHGAFGIVAMP